MAYWNPYTDGTRATYDRVWADANRYEGKAVRVTKADGSLATGTARIKTCASGALGMTLSGGNRDQWVSPDFSAIELT